MVQKAVENGCHKTCWCLLKSMTLVPTSLFSDRAVDIPVVQQTTRQSGEERVVGMLISFMGGYLHPACLRSIFTGYSWGLSWPYHLSPPPSRDREAPVTALYFLGSSLHACSPMEANHQQRTVNFTGSGSAPTAQMEPPYKKRAASSKRCINIIGQRTRLVTSRFETYFPARGILALILKAPELMRLYFLLSNQSVTTNQQVRGTPRTVMWRCSQSRPVEVYGRCDPASTRTRDRRTEANRQRCPCDPAMASDHPQSMRRGECFFGRRMVQLSRPVACRPTYSLRIRQGLRFRSPWFLWLVYVFAKGDPFCADTAKVAPSALRGSGAAYLVCRMSPWWPLCPSCRRHLCFLNG